LLQHFSQTGLFVSKEITPAVDRSGSLERVLIGVIVNNTGIEGLKNSEAELRFSGRARSGMSGISGRVPPKTWGREKREVPDVVG
jgi:hypothetical protein